MRPTLIDLGFFEIPTYGVLLGIAFYVSIKVAAHFGKREGYPEELFYDAGIGIMLSAMFGAKVLYLVINYQTAFQSFAMFFSELKTGFVYYGGFIGAFAFSFWFVRRRVDNQLRVFDIVVLPVPLGQAIGRLGCFCAGCCYGGPSGVPWAVTFPPGSPAVAAYGLGHHIHPTQLYSSLAGAIVFCILLLAYHRKWFDGQVLATYLFVYAISRSILELFRGDEARGAVGLLSTSQMISIGLFLGGVALYALLWKRPVDRTPPEIPNPQPS